MLKDVARVKQENARSEAVESAPFALPPLLDFAAAPALARALRQHVATAEDVVLDGRMVDRVSTPCLQILLATAMDAQSRGVSFRLHEPSPVLTNAIAELGLPPGFDQ